MAGEKGRNLNKRTQKANRKLCKSPLQLGNTTIDQAPLVSRGLVTSANNKGKGLLVNDISANELRSELTSSILGANKGKSGIDENGDNEDNNTGFFTRLLTLDNDVMDMIDKDPNGGLWVEKEHLDAIEKVILEQSTPTNQVSSPVVAANTSSQLVRQDGLLPGAFKDNLALALAPSGVYDRFNPPMASPIYTGPPHQVIYGPSSLINQSRGYMYPGYQTSSAQASEVGRWNSPGQWRSQMVHEFSMLQQQFVQQVGFGEPNPCGQGLFDLAPLPAQLGIQQPEPGLISDIQQYQGYMGSDYQHDPMYYQIQEAEQAHMGSGAGGFTPEQWSQQQQQPGLLDFTLLLGAQPPSSF